MKERWDRLNKNQKRVLAAHVVLAVVMVVVYAFNLTRQGMTFRDKYLAFSQQGETRVYTGSCQGAKVTFTVDGDTITSRWGKEERVYTVTRDESALPSREEILGYEELVPVQIHEGDKLLFRGSWNSYLGDHEVYDTEGKLVFLNGPFETTRKELEQVPTMAELIRIWNGPELHAMAHVGFLLLGVLMSALAVCELIFAQELFHWNASWLVKDAERAEPSEWELLRRTIGAAVLLGAAMLCYYYGLSP